MDIAPRTERYTSSAVPRRTDRRISRRRGTHATISSKCMSDTPLAIQRMKPAAFTMVRWGPVARARSHDSRLESHRDCRWRRFPDGGLSRFGLEVGIDKVPPRQFRGRCPVTERRNANAGNLEVLALVHVFTIMPPILYALPVRETRSLAGMGDTSARGQRGHWLSWCIDGWYLSIRPFDFNRSLWMIVVNAALRDGSPGATHATPCRRRLGPLRARIADTLGRGGVDG